LYANNDNLLCHLKQYC